MPDSNQCGLTTEQVDAIAELLLSLPPPGESVDRTEANKSRPAAKENQQRKPQ